MKHFFQKVREKGLNIPNILSFISLEFMRIWGVFFGTLRFYIKARLFGIKTGKRIRAHGPVGLMRWPGGKISIGDDVSLVSSWRRATACALAFPVRLRVFGSGGEIRIGDRSQLSGTSISARSCCIEIGKQVLIAPNCIITDSDFHAHWPAEARIDSPGYEKDRPVKIDDFAWIGMNCIILKGSHIGKGVIIGAGSVVCGYIPPDSIAAGTPARVIGQVQNKEKLEDNDS